MLDIRWIREQPAEFDAALRRRGAAPAAEAVLDLDRRRRAVQTRLQEMQTRRNEASKAIGAAKSRGEDASSTMAEVAKIKESMTQLEADEQAIAGDLDALLATFPNAPARDVPDGTDESANVELRRFQDPPRFPFPPKDHVEIGAGLGMMDFDSAAKISGARFVVLKKTLARLERALAAFMIDIHCEEFGYTEIAPPLLVRDSAVFGTGQLPKFAGDLFQTRDDFWLIPTAEVPLTNMVADRILNEGDLPLRYTAYTPCFRSEAGAAGRDTRGMIRQHQFGKVELVSIVHPDTSDDELERLTGAAEEILKRLGLAYRVVALCAGDMGFAARKTYDIEVWLPAQGRYREISSCSNCGDFQARRMKARFRAGDEKGTRFVHSLNGSGLAVGRTLIAILENYQQQDGSVILPAAIGPYMGGVDVIAAHA